MPRTRLEPPDVDYQPRDPRTYHPAIGLIGCGGITSYHLRAYRAAGYRVAALCDLRDAAARQRQQDFYPDADVYTDYRALLDRADIEVVDVATHPVERVPIIEAALKAEKHVLSQKPFVVDLAVGERLVELAKERKRRLAVNQNGRWAPHFSYIRHAIATGHIGVPLAVHMAVHWNHGWVAGTEFEKIRHLILFDYAIHWFDILGCFLAENAPRRVFATTTRSATQEIEPALLAEVLIQYEGAHASLVFDGDARHGPLDTTYVAGSEGTLTSSGPSNSRQRVTFAVGAQKRSPRLEGKWFPDGFHGTMGELLRAIEEDREPSNSAADNLKSLALCFAAVASAERGEPVRPGSVRRLEHGDPAA